MTPLNTSVAPLGREDPREPPPLLPPLAQRFKLHAILHAVTVVQDIKNAVAQLPAEELSAFRAWFEEFDAVRLDEKIERDAASGRLDGLADEALADHLKGRSREL